MKKALSTFFSILVCITCAGNSLQRSLQDYADSCGAEVGMALLVEGKDTVIINDGLYPMNSVMKMFQALPAAIELSRRGIALDSTVCISRSDLDLNTWSPMLREHKDSSFLISYGDLLSYSLGQSDNNACDIIYDKVISIDEVNEFWHEKGIDGFSIRWNEAQMHEAHERSDDNVTSPLAAARAINYFVPFCLTSSDLNTSQVGAMLMNCSTGLNRIPKPLSDTGAFIAHKTGTGFSDDEGRTTGINDVAYIIPADGRSYSLAVFVKRGKPDIAATEKIIADISEIVYKHLHSLHTYSCLSAVN